MDRLKSLVTEDTLRDMVRRGYIAEGLTRAADTNEVLAHLEDDEVMVLQNLFTADRIRKLGDTPRLIAEETEDLLGFVVMLRQISKVFSTRDIIEEAVAGDTVKCLELEVSEMEAESDDGLAGNVVVDSPAGREPYTRALLHH
ncbi:hypothetical protein C2845_PM03G26660 [Panicum miliaceum]|uniref:Uncharacterized protein n=1 Tax=Panicum miliaceum TaxID=4540 RepID=A0A3L6TBX9_PANMI|nr:hypothetical protein C2845_PM03G26660 [Panicum miliaceum]